MNWYSQLTQLILDFYREDPLYLKQLAVLRRCKISRHWGVLRIYCPDSSTAESIVLISEVLKEPIIQLRLVNQINILVDRKLVAVLPVSPSKLTI